MMSDKKFVLIDGYTLAIAHIDSGTIFSGCHSRRAISEYDDSILIAMEIGLRTASYSFIEQNSKIVRDMNGSAHQLQFFRVSIESELARMDWVAVVAENL